MNVGHIKANFISQTALGVFLSYFVTVFTVPVRELCLDKVNFKLLDSLINISLCIARRALHHDGD